VYRYLLASFLLAAQAFASPSLLPNPEYSGSDSCGGCHEQQHQQWLGSHHQLAIQPANRDTVLGDFEGAHFSYAGKDSRFSRAGDKYLIETEGADGKIQQFKVEYVFGVYPLQQYLLALPDGRLNALSISWDSRPAEEGGQRWFHLYPEEEIDADDPLHWTGPYQNWNSRCAECHSTDLQKNFDSQSNSYNTTWAEINVSCEACHGPGAEHEAQARSGVWASDGLRGLEVALESGGQWLLEPGAPIAKNLSPNEHAQQLDSCGRCHSRRGTLGNYEYDRNLLDTHRLSLLEENLYHPDGQILDEVYVYGSFVQSKMYQAGVVCTDCHNPHTGELKAEGNNVCAQCHSTEVFDTKQHHHHTPGSSGADCANCHMPETTYMVVDPRRDHSIRSPRPDLSVTIGTPNACNQCHTEENATWALNAMRDWGVEFNDTGSHPARAISMFRRGDARAVPGLLEIAQDTSQPPIWRATATVALSQYASQESYQSALQLLQSPDPMLRMAAVRSLDFLPPQQRFRVLNPRLTDPSRAVRMETARLLAGVSVDQLDTYNRKLLTKLNAEYLEVMNMDADMPGVQLQLGVFHSAQQRLPEAEQAYLRAIAMNPQFIPALLNLADLYRSQGRDDEARQLLQQAIEIAPRQGNAHHALGLLETRAGNQEQALDSLQKAARLEQNGTRYRYVYAIALHDKGDVSAAISELQKLQRSVPDNPDVLLALINYCKEGGRINDARRYADKLKQLVPANPQLQQLYDSLQ
jgi:predicted CXXCH cytochrome family protein